MSKLADVIRRNQRVDAAPMGFGAARPAVKPSMLVGLLSAGAPGDAGEADVVLIDGLAAKPDLSRLRDAAGTSVFGLQAASLSNDRVKELRQTGIDFIVFEADSTLASALLDEETGYVLRTPAQPEELFLRSLEPLSLDALYLDWLSLPLTVMGQLELSRMGMLARKPLLAKVSADATSEDLQCLRSAGVAVLLTDSPEGVARLKEAVLALPQRKAKSDERAVLTLPRGAAAAKEDDDDDE
jgi:hypothetical protein